MSPGAWWLQLGDAFLDYMRRQPLQPWWEHEGLSPERLRERAALGEGLYAAAHAAGLAGFTPISPLLCLEAVTLEGMPECSPEQLAEDAEVWLWWVLRDLPLAEHKKIGALFSCWPEDWAEQVAHARRSAALWRTP